MAHKLSKITLAVLSATTLSLTATTNAQESQQELNEDVEVIEVSGIRASLASAMNEKRFKNNLVESQCVSHHTPPSYQAELDLIQGP